LLWLSVLLAGAAAALAGLLHFRQPLQSETFFVEADPPVPVERVRLASRNSFPVHFLLLHGYVANRRQLLHLAQVLAASGGDVYVMDLPGRGDHRGRASPLPEDGPMAQLPTPLESEAALTVVHHLERRLGITRERLVLIGHSTGGGVAVDVARRLLPAATVLLSSLERPVAPGLPPNLLIITARFDFPPLLRAAERMFEQAGSDSAGRREFLAWHSSLPYHDAVQQAILEWTTRALPGAALRIPPYLNLWLLGLEWAAVLLLASLVWPLGRLAAWALAQEPLGEVVPESRLALWMPPQLAGFAFACGGVVVAALALLRWQKWPLPLDFLRLGEGGYLATVFFLSIFGVLWVHRQLPWVRSPRESAARTAAALALALYVVAACGGFITWQIFDVWPSPGRLARLPVLLLLFLPYAFGEELLVRAYSPPAADRELSGLLLWRAPLLAAIAAGAFFLGTGADLLAVMTLPLVALTVAEHYFASALRSSLESAYGVAVFRAVFLAWLFAAAFPLR